ncbi:sigma factor-like helix-turn-helix DNA-binding protein [Tissierella praeacuta]|uniref:RNA polymerase sigma factor n=1 Tax=Tissierella praeacuta TaxID=43131 RepID=UPI003342B035
MEIFNIRTQDVYQLEDYKGIDYIKLVPEKYGHVLKLRIFKDKTHQEIASILNIKEVTVRKRYERGKKLLKNELEKMNTYDEE